MRGNKKKRKMIKRNYKRKGGERRICYYRRESKISERERLEQRVKEKRLKDERDTRREMRKGEKKTVKKEKKMADRQKDWFEK